MDILKRFWIWFLEPLSNQRGEVGDGDDSADDTPDDAEDKEDQDDDFGDLDLELEDDDKDEDKEIKLSKKELDDLKDKATKHADLEKEVEKLKTDKKNLNKALHEERQGKKKETGGKPDPLTKAQLKQILADNKDDPDVLFNMVEYIAQQAAEGKAGDAVKATEVSRKQKEQKDFLETHYPSISEEGSDIRLDVEKTKGEFGLNDHPYGDYFAVAVRVLQDLPALLQTAFKNGEDKGLGKKAEEKRQETIKANKLPKGSAYGKDAEGMSEAQLEAASQMGLTKSQLKYYKQIAGKKARTISVGE